MFHVRELPLQRRPFDARGMILLQVGFGLSAFATGMLFLGYTRGDLVMKAMTTRMFRRFGYRTTMQGAMVGVIGSLLGCALFKTGTPFRLILLVLFAGGCFRSFTMTALGTLSYSEVPHEEMTHATTLNQAVLQLSQAVGVSFTVLALQLASGAAAEQSGIADVTACRIALVVVALVTMLAFLPIGRLAPGAGSEISGHRPG